MEYMPTCGNCKAEGQTVSHIRECYAHRTTTTVPVDVSNFARQYAEDLAASTLRGSK